MAQKRATSTEAVVNAAARVFLEKGFEVSTIEDVAREAERLETDRISVREEQAMAAR